jgi:serine/threonine protein kinase/WD40 repeat protein
MTAEAWIRVREVFDAAIARPEESRASYLEEVCVGNPDLKREVEALLSSAGKIPTSFLELPAPLGLSGLGSKASAAPGKTAKSGTAARLPPGAHLGPYEILGLLGVGGMGEVYRARDPRLGREVAIKVLPAVVAADSDRLNRFEKEARAVGALNHPNIVTVHDVGSHGGTLYVVTELLEGETLRELLINRAPTVRQALGWAMQVAQGLAAAHRKGIVHRDLKPENLFLTTDGRMKILDFGLAKVVSRAEVETAAATASNSTQPGILLGTVAYMSPEQVRAEGLDHRSDLFSFGTVLYESLAQEHPFRRETAPATLTAILHESPRRLSTVRSEIPPGVEKIVERCLEKNREQRFQSAHDLSLAIEAILEKPSGMAALLEVQEKSPYPGLSSFAEEDAGRFFGREGEVKGLWQKICGRRLLAVIGPSGAGKTSFVRAGVVAGRPEGWTAIVSTPGTAPLRGLGQAVGPELARDPGALRKLAAFDDPETAFELLAHWRRGHDEALVVIDQFEELFTLNELETQARFAALLERLVVEADVHVLLSLRDDFLMRCHDYAGLAPVFADLTPLGALTQEGLRRAVAEPAATQGYRFEEDALVDEMVGAVEGVRGALPLLAFAVLRLWERRDREKKLLTRKAYREIGGVEGALAQHAEATLERIGAQHEGVVREIFRNLTTAQGTRAVLGREELLSALPDRARAETVLEQLIDARLLTSYQTEGSEGETGGDRVEILHESLLKAWPRLLRWQTQDADGAQLRDQLRQAARLWQERGRTEDLLWTGASFLDYRVWRERYPGGLSSVEADFAQSMAALASRKRRRKLIAAAAIFAGLTVGLVVTAVLWRQSKAKTRRAEVQTRRAEASKLLALGQLEFARYPTGALAYAIKSLELSDTTEARYFALRALQSAPVATQVELPLRDHLSDGEVATLAFSPNGDSLAVGGLWNTQILHRDGRKSFVLPDKYTSGHAVIDVGFSGDRLVTNSHGDVRLWSLPEGHEVRRTQLDEGSSNLWTRGEGFFTSTTVGQRMIVRWWPAGNGESRLIGTMEPPPAAADVNPAGTEFAYGLGRKIYTRSLKSWASPPRLVAEHAADIVGILFHPDGTQLAASDNSGQTRIWSIEGKVGRPLRILDASSLRSFSSGGRWLATVSTVGADHLVQLWDLTAPEYLKPLLIHTGANSEINDVTFDPAERWLATGLDQNHLALWPLGGTYPRVLGDNPTRVIDLEFTPDGTTLLSASWEDVRAWPLTARRGREARILLHVKTKGNGMNHVVACDPSGKRVVVSAAGGHVFVVPLEGGTPRELKGFSEDTFSISVAFSPDGRRVAASPLIGPADQKVIRIWDLESGAVQVVGPVPGTRQGWDGVDTLAFLDENRILAGVLASGLVIFDLRNGRATVLSRALHSVFAVSRNAGFGFGSLQGGNLYATGVLRFTFDGNAPKAIPSHPNAHGAALDPTETVLASGDLDGMIRVGPVSGAAPHLLFGHEGSVAPFAFSPDGRWLASGGADRTIRLWPVPDTSEAPPQKRTHEEFLAMLRSWTNMRAVPDPKSPTGWKLEPGPFRGWQKLPKW